MYSSTLRRITVLLAVATLLIPMTGCHLMCTFPRLAMLFGEIEEVEVIAPPSDQFHVFVSPAWRARLPSRVVMIGSGQSGGELNAEQTVMAELASQFRARGMMEVITPAGERMNGHWDNILQGKYNERELSRLGLQYNADTVALIKVNELHSVAPMRVSLTLAMVDCDQAIVGCSVDGVWDLANPQTQQAFDGYWRQSAVQEYEREIRKFSPSSILKFATDEICQRLLEEGFTAATNSRILQTSWQAAPPCFDHQ
jgi:hypothetical protein